LDKIYNLVEQISKNMVEVFKTNVQKKAESKMILSTLNETFPSLKVNFDLDDPDKILRVEGHDIKLKEIIHLTNSKGFECEILK